MRRRNLLVSLVVAGSLVAGIGVATSYFGDPPKATGSKETIAGSLAASGPNGEMLARLKDYARSMATDEPASIPAAGRVLPDVDTMIERLAARLETTPQDIKGWRMLGWSYFHIGRYKEAAGAYAKAVKLDPSSAELKLSYAEAKAKAAPDTPETAASSQTESIASAGAGAIVGTHGKSDAGPSREPDALIRAMVDGLAARLESAPRDVEGWARLIRSRVVLGEREVAATMLRKALEVFKDDPAATHKIAAAAVELGLKAE
jgi:tetratricopeptide (TPR) repeat protein